MDIKFKVWLERNGEPVFGEGRRRLLEYIQRYGSINRAAAEIGLPYRKAWSSLTAMEHRLGFKLLERRIGGASGGGTCLTERGQDFLCRYGALIQELQNLVGEKNNTLFGDRYAKLHNQAGERSP